MKVSALFDREYFRSVPTAPASDSPDLWICSCGGGTSTPAVSFLRTARMIYGSCVGHDGEDGTPMSSRCKTGEIPLVKDR